MSKRRSRTNGRVPFIAFFADADHVQRGGPDQTGERDAQWLTPDLCWTGNVFSAARFERSKTDILWLYLDAAINRQLPVYTREQELAAAME